MNERLVEEMALYCAHHKDLRNRLAHVIAGPAILVSLMIIASWKSVEFAGVNLSLGFVAAVAFLVYHARLDATLAVVAAPLTLGALAVSEWTTSALTYGEATVLAAVCFGGGWVLLSIGHYLEGHAPTLFESWRQPLIAPLFLAAEVLLLLGFKRDFWAAVEARHSKNLGGASTSR